MSINVFLTLSRDENRGAISVAGLVGAPVNLASSDVNIVGNDQDGLRQVHLSKQLAKNDQLRPPSIT